MNPNQLDIEITENSMLHYNEELIEKLKAIKELGITISIDDFGTGYSSLSYLKQLPVDYLKIDRSFISNLINNESGTSMVAAIISLAHALKLQVVAEGVENEAEYNLLKKLQCEFVQGYYYSKPINTHDFEQYMKQI